MPLCAGLAAGAQGKLKNPAKAVFWNGTAGAGAGPVGEVPQCAAGCDRFDLKVDLPGGVWNNKPGGVQVAIRWTPPQLFDNLNLYVYQGGSLVAASEGIIATAQAVLIPSAANGVYQVYVAYDDVESSSPQIPYEGLAEVEYDPKPRPRRRLIPDLVPRPQRNLSFDPGGIFFDEISVEHPSCYVTEVAEEGAQTCLRFDQILANVGEGPMEIRFATPAGETPPLVDAFQRLYHSDGRSEDLGTGPVEFHPEHGHYHFTSFGASRLWAVDSSGRRFGKHPLRKRRGPPRHGSEPVREGEKVSFCLADIEIDFWGEKGDGPRTYYAPNCLFPFSSDGVSDLYVQGITAGWTDVYDWYLPDQYIEVSGVPDGIYILDTIADPDGVLVEARETNNCSSVYIRLSNVDSDARAVELLGPGPPCP
ncbi:MAG: lysyl oxidase family protein [Bryobacterales bacterium]